MNFQNSLINSSRERIFSYDFIRIIAILAVIMIHCVNYYLILYHDIASIQYTISNILSSASRFAVPFFLILSGTFMLDENRNLPNLKLKNKIIKLFIIFIIWSGFNTLIIQDSNLLNTFLSGYYHLWFLLLIIGLYLITPILRLICKKGNEKYVLYFILLSIIFQFLPTTLDGLFSDNKAFTTYSNYYYINLVTGYTSYYLAGWLIHNNIEKIVKFKNTILFGAFLSLILNIIFIQIKTSLDFSISKIFYDNYNILIFIYSISLYIILKIFLDKKEHLIKNSTKKIITELSKLSFGVYLIHVYIYNYYKELLRFSYIENFVLKIFLCFICTTILSFIIVYIISKIKYLKEVIKI